MFRFFRKHRWLLIIVMTVTAGTFVYWGAAPASRGGGGRGGSYGLIYGHEVTAEAYYAARNELYLSYWQQTGEWPDKSPSFNRDSLEQQVYVRLLLKQKANDLGIHVNEDTVESATAEMLRSIGRGQPVSLEQFVQGKLQPEGLTAADFQQFIRSSLVIQQLVQTLGLSGALVPPHEAGLLYDREHQEVSAQAVFFAASNYLAQVPVTPAAIEDFYTKNMAAYREPDRVQVDYVAFETTNFLAQSKAEWARTNFEETVSAVYAQYGATEFASYKTPDEAKVKIREELIQQRALTAAVQQARDFAAELFAKEPVKAENLAAFAGQKGLAVHTTAPFAAAAGPEEFMAPPAFTKTAFQLNTDEPLAGPLVSPEAVYVIALAKQIPSTIPSLEQIRRRVTSDFQEREAVALAQRDGTNFYFNATVQLVAGNTFAKSAVAAGHVPLMLTPFSLSSAEVPEAGDHAELGQLKQAAFTTPAGHVSSFVLTAEGGFVLFVQALQPIDETKKVSELPQFLSQVRRARQSEAFNLWLQTEASRELGGILKDLSARKPAAGAAKQP
jgi:hypothetical protein